MQKTPGRMQARFQSYLRDCAVDKAGVLGLYWRNVIPLASDVVAAMTFGFWVSLLNRGNEVALWRPALYRVFRPVFRGPRGEIYGHFEHLRMFRNRIMHHEPIYRRSRSSDRDRIYELIHTIMPEVGAELRLIDPLPEVLSRTPRLLRNRGMP